MSRRDSDSRHHRSRYDHREPSPKRVKRDGKTATEQPTSHLKSTERIDRDKKHHRKLQDSDPLGSKVVTGSKIETVSLSKESDKKNNGYREGTKNSSDNIDAPPSRSHFQHDERAGQVGRSYRHKDTTARDWWKDNKPRDERTRFGGSYKAEPNSKQLSKKRPSFRETKLPVNDSATQVNTERKEEIRKPLEKSPVDRSDKRVSGGRDPHRNETERMKVQPRVRYGGSGGGNGGGVDGGFGGSFRGRDRFSDRQRPSGGRVEKWKHDLYDEANKSPTSKNEEDQIAKVEALLAS